MNTNKTKTALVTGANSGIGFETIRQLSKLGYGNIILACRTVAKGETTRQQMIKEGFKDVYTPVAIDVAEASPSYRALEELKARDQKIDLLVLNACVSPANLEKNTQGMELTFASALLGHHILTTGLLEVGLLAKNARIVGAGSEAARGNVPMMSLPKIEEVVQKEFGGDVHKAFRAFMLPSDPKKHTSMRVYSLAKLFVSLWSASLARKLPNGMISNSISPGATPDTSFVRHQPWMVRNVMMPMMKLFGSKMAGTVEAAAKRYLEILHFTSHTNGKLWLSKKGKMAGPMEVFTSDYTENKAYQDAVWNIVTQLAKEAKPQTV